MKPAALRIITPVVLCAFLSVTTVATMSGCTQSVRPDSRNDSASEGKDLELKPGQPIRLLWDRWGQKGGDYLLLNGKDIVEAYPGSSNPVFGGGTLATLLSQSPSPEVSSLVRSHERWSTLAQVSFGLTLASALVAVAGYTKTRGGSTTLGVPMINALWAISGVSLAVMFTSVGMQQRRLDEALSAHNSQAVSSPARGALDERSTALQFQVTLK